MLCHNERPKRIGRDTTFAYQTAIRSAGRCA